jgi:carbonic anhydrase
LIEIVYRFDPQQPNLRSLPANPAEARSRLEAGNRAFAELLAVGESGAPARQVLPLDPRAVGLGHAAGVGPAQTPFAAVLGCSDARVPLELILQQGSNALFVVRVAGNMVGSECLGSFGFALQSFPECKLLAVLGHTRCGAVSTAVDAYLNPPAYLTLASDHPLKSIVDAILVAVRSAALGLETAHGREVANRRGYRDALIVASVAINAAWGAFALRHLVPPERGADVEVFFGVYDLDNRWIRLPLSTAPPFPANETGLFPAPAGPEEFRSLAAAVCGGALVGALLG